MNIIHFCLTRDHTVVTTSSIEPLYVQTVAIVTFQQIVRPKFYQIPVVSHSCNIETAAFPAILK